MQTENENKFADANYVESVVNADIRLLFDFFVKR